MSEIQAGVIHAAKASVLAQRLPPNVIDAVVTRMYAPRNPARMTARVTGLVACLRALRRTLRADGSCVLVLRDRYVQADASAGQWNGRDTCDFVDDAVEGFLSEFAVARRLAAHGVAVHVGEKAIRHDFEKRARYSDGGVDIAIPGAGLTIDVKRKKQYDTETSDGFWQQITPKTAASDHVPGLFVNKVTNLPAPEDGPDIHVMTDVHGRWGIAARKTTAARWRVETRADSTRNNVTWDYWVCPRADTESLDDLAASLAERPECRGTPVLAERIAPKPFEWTLWPQRVAVGLQDDGWFVKNQYTFTDNGTRTDILRVTPSSRPAPWSAARAPNGPDDLAALMEMATAPGGVVFDPMAVTEDIVATGVRMGRVAFGANPLRGLTAA